MLCVVKSPLAAMSPRARRQSAAPGARPGEVIAVAAHRRSQLASPVDTNVLYVLSARGQLLATTIGRDLKTLRFWSR